MTTELREKLVAIELDKETREYNMLSESVIAQIAQAFQEAGYEDTTKWAPHQFIGKPGQNLMTGQEWYNQFRDIINEQVLGGDTNRQFTQFFVLEAAKLAAGLE